MIKNLDTGESYDLRDNHPPILLNYKTLPNQSPALWQNYWQLHKQKKQDLFDYSELGNFEKVKEILENDKIVINGELGNGMTALHLAVQGAHEKVCEVLVQYGAELDKRSKEGKTPLHIAAINGNFLKKRKKGEKFTLLYFS